MPSIEVPDINPTAKRDFSLFRLCFNLASRPEQSAKFFELVCKPGKSAR